MPCSDFLKIRKAVRNVLFSENIALETTKKVSTGGNLKFKGKIVFAHIYAKSGSIYIKLRPKWSTAHCTWPSVRVPGCQKSQMTA